MRLTTKDKNTSLENKYSVKINDSPYVVNVNKIIDKLGQLEDIEEELGIDLITLFKALTQGCYYKTPKYDDKNERIRPAYNCRLGVGLVERPYLICGDYGFNIKDYGKTWALTREELTDGK